MVKQGGAWKKTPEALAEGHGRVDALLLQCEGQRRLEGQDVGPPERLQWLGSPRWSRHHDRMSSLSAQVSARGRLFYIMDEGSRISILLPSKWQADRARRLQRHDPLEEADREMEHAHVAAQVRPHAAHAPAGGGWRPHLRHARASASRSSCSTARRAKCSGLSRKRRARRKSCTCNGVIYALVNPKRVGAEGVRAEAAAGSEARRDRNTSGTRSRARSWRGCRRRARCCGRRRSEDRADHAAADGKRVVYYNGDKLVCLDAADRQRRSGPAVRRPKRKLYEFNFGPRRRAQQATWCSTPAAMARMKGLDAETGKELWDRAAREIRLSLAGGSHRQRRARLECGHDQRQPERRIHRARSASPAR